MSKVMFVSGHRDVTPTEFAEHYAHLIVDASLEECSFVVGDYYGVDIMTQQLLKQLGTKNVIVFHMFESPRNYVDGFETRGGFRTDEDRDSAMTHLSDEDIAWVREGKENSGTAQNIKRRAIYLEQLKDMG